MVSKKKGGTQNKDAIGTTNNPIILESSDPSDDGGTTENGTATQKLPSSSSDSSSSDSSQTPVPILSDSLQRDIREFHYAARTANKRQKQAQAQSSNKKKPKQGEPSTFTGNQPVNRKAPAQRPAPAQTSNIEAPSASNRKAPAQTANRKAPIIKKYTEIKLFDDVKVLLNILDSYHDFASGNRVKDKHIRKTVGKIITDYISKKNNPELVGLFNDLTTPSSKLEHNIYKKYVEENDDIEVCDEILLHDGTNKIDIFKKIAEKFLIPEAEKNNIHIIDDRGSYIGCDTNKFDKFRISYASWFDKGGCNNKGTNHYLYDEIKMDKNEMFYIESISGSLNINHVATGKIKLNKNSTIDFVESKDNDDRPGVSKYASHMNSTTFLNAFQNIQDQTDKIMFLMDLKRAGDGLQIKSAQHTVVTSIPIFITSDIIAATIAVNNNIRTVLTSKDADILGSNSHSLKYAHVLLPKFLVDPTKLAEINEAALNDFINKNAEEWGKYANGVLEDISKLKKSLNIAIHTLINNTNNDVDKLIKVVLENIKILLSFKIKEQKYYNKLNIRIRKDIQKRKHEGYTAPVPIEQTDLNVFVKAFTDPTNGIFAKIDKGVQFEDDLLKLVKEHLSTYTQEIQSYDSNSERLNEYLKYIVKLTNHYVDTKNLATLFNQIYKDLINIHTVIKKDLNTDTVIRFIFRKNPQFLHSVDNKILCKNMIIAKYIDIIFKRNEDRYYEYIGNFDKNYIITCPIGMVFMEFLLKNKDDTSKKTSLINDMRNLDLLKEIDASQLKFLVEFSSPDNGHTHEFVNKVLYPTQPFLIPVLTESNRNTLSEEVAVSLLQLDKTDLEKFYERLVFTYTEYMAEPDISDTTVGGAKRVRSSENHKKPSYIEKLMAPFKSYIFTSLSSFIELPFGVKELIIKLSPIKDIILRAIFIEYYNSKKYDKHQIIKELDMVQKCKKLLSDVPITGGGRITKLRRLLQAQIPKMKKKIHSEDAFKLFTESLYFYPELLDPVMAIYMKYSNSPLPVYGLTQEVLTRSPISVEKQVKKQRIKAFNDLMSEAERDVGSTARGRQRRL